MNIVDLIERSSILPVDINFNIDESPATNTDDANENKFIAYCKQKKWEIGVIGIAMLALGKKHEEVLYSNSKCSIILFRKVLKKCSSLFRINQYQCC